MPLNDRVRFLKRLKELRRFGYSPEYALRRATQEDSELSGGPADRSPAGDGDDPPSVTASQKREELRYEMARSANGSSAGTVNGIPGVFRRDGLSLEEMAKRLRSEPAFAHIRHADDLVDLLHTAVFGTTNMEAQGIPLTPTQLHEQLGIDPSKKWWEDSWRPKE